MTTTMDLSLWIDKAVKDLREEDQKIYRARFMEQWRHAYESFKASGQSETEARSLAFALLGNAHEVRARLKRTLITQTEQDLLDRLTSSDAGAESFRMSRMDGLVVLSICFILSLPIWFIVPVNVILKVALLFFSTVCLLTVIMALVTISTAWDRWIRERYTIQGLLLWRAATLPIFFAVVYAFAGWLTYAITEWWLPSTDEACRNGSPLWAVAAQFVFGWGYMVVTTLHTHVSLARKLTPLENQTASMTEQTHLVV